MLKKKHHKTLVISDVHLGTNDSKAKELVRFLKKNTCEILILNGDIIDGWRLKKNGKWKKKHTRFSKVVLKMMEQFNTQVYYVRGNHDDFLDHVIPLKLGRFNVVKDLVLESFGKRYYICHGDIFDHITTNLQWLAKLGDMGYSFLLWINKIYNNNRMRKGLPYYSLSQAIKQKVKSAVSYISDFEEELVELARSKKCHGVICGHIHHPSINNYDEIVSMNSGDWVESMTALSEDFNGKWKIIYYSELSKQEKKDDEKKRLKLELLKAKKMETA
jgi:UDP-2,3-diacylglucosamine pyrophosphatase LpxH